MNNHVLSSRSYFRKCSLIIAMTLTSIFIFSTNISLITGRTYFLNVNKSIQSIHISLNDLIATVCSSGFPFTAPIMMDDNGLMINSLQFCLVKSLASSDDRSTFAILGNVSMNRDLKVLSLSYYL